MEVKCKKNIWIFDPYAALPGPRNEAQLMMRLITAQTCAHYEVTDQLKYVGIIPNNTVAKGFYWVTYRAYNSKDKTVGALIVDLAFWNGSVFLAIGDDGVTYQIPPSMVEHISPQVKAPSYPEEFFRVGDKIKI